MKVIGVTPAGRERYLRILVPYLLENRHLLHEHRFWVNTSNESDRQYILGLCEAYPDFFKAEFLADDEPDGIFTIHRFFENCCDKDAIYIRIDDDVCWIAKDAIKKMITARLEDRSKFLIYGNTINHPVCSQIHQQNGLIPLVKGIATGDGLCEIAWRSGEFAELAHNAFLDKLESGNERDFFIQDVVIPPQSRKRVAINFISWLGEDMSACNGKVGEKEEDWLSIDRPLELNRSLKIIGDAMVAHFSYFPQRRYLESTHVLERYERISKHDA
jgi:hypothetical protein